MLSSYQRQLASCFQCQLVIVHSSVFVASQDQVLWLSFLLFFGRRPSSTSQRYSRQQRPGCYYCDQCVYHTVFFLSQGWLKFIDSFIAPDVSLKQFTHSWRSLLWNRGQIYFEMYMYGIPESQATKRTVVIHFQSLLFALLCLISESACDADFIFNRLLCY